MSTGRPNASSDATSHVIRGSTIASQGPSRPVPSSAAGAAYPLVQNSVKLRFADITADVIADSIVEFCNKHGDVVTNLRLQKLLYYAQAWYLALYDKPLFSEPFEAWPNGPVQPKVFARFRSFGTGPIARTGRIMVLPKKIDEHIKDLVQSYGSLSTFELELLTCEESPWRDARGNLSPTAHSRTVIDNTAMQKYYKLKKDGKEQKAADIQRHTRKRQSTKRDSPRGRSQGK